MTDIATQPDLSAIKQRQQATWSSGDYHYLPLDRAEAGRIAVTRMALKPAN